MVERSFSRLPPIKNPLNYIQKYPLSGDTANVNQGFTPL